MRTRFVINGLMWFHKHPVITGCLLLSLSFFGLVKLLQAGYSKALDVNDMQTDLHATATTPIYNLDTTITDPEETAEDRIQKLRDRALRRKKLKHDHPDKICYINPVIETNEKTTDEDVAKNLTCEKKDAISLTSNETNIYISGKNINFIRFRAIVPLEAEKTFEYGEYAYIMRPTLKSVDLTKEHVGHMEHYFSRMCINIQAADANNPPDNSPLVYLENCDRPLGVFTFDKDGILKHNTSGKCISPKGDSDNPKENTPLVISSSCKAHFEVHLDGLIRHVTSKMCIHPLGGGSHPSIGQELCLYPNCDQADRLKYRWFSPPETAPMVNVDYQLDQDFAEIEIVTGDDHTKYDFNLMINKKQEPSEIIDKPNEDHPDNVIVFMFDEVSSAHFYRKMKKTKEILLKQMEAFNFNKHTLISSSFQDNFEALLYGKEGKKKSLFDRFNKRGYMTLFSVDRPTATKEEFRRKIKAHHDATLFWDIASKKYNFGLSPYCLGLQPIYSPSFNYLKSFFRNYKSSKKFAVLGLSEITRWNSNGLTFMDSYLADFLENHLSSLKNSIVVFASSKGSKSGPNTKSEQGKLEARLPLLTIWASEDRVKKLSLPDIKKNVDYLTTPYDVHETLATLIDMRGELDKSYNVLGHLRERECDQADVPSYLCPC